MTDRVEMNYKTVMDEVLNQLINEVRCLCCGDVLDGHWWNRDAIDIAKPSYISLEYCSFVCERTYNNLWGFQREWYDHTTKF